MAPSRTSTVKNKNASKHAANGSGIRNSKTVSRAQSDGVSKSKGKKATQSKGAPPKQQKQGSKLATLKKKRRVYTEKELGIPALNMITPVGVEKPKGKKKGKVFVDDRVGFFSSFFSSWSVWGERERLILGLGDWTNQSFT